MDSATLDPAGQHGPPATTSLPSTVMAALDGTLAPAHDIQQPIISFAGNDQRGATISFEGDVAGGSIIKDSEVVLNLTSTVIEQERVPAEEARALRQRSYLLDEVYAFWVGGLLEDSLHNGRLIELRLCERPEAVVQPWEDEIQLPCHEPQAESPSIVELFDPQSGELLILGAPGSGKTTVLLTLARALIERARQDAAYPILVVLPLSSWAEKRLPLAEWMVDELATHHDVPRQLGSAWVASDSILPLLDGLDEVQEGEREACVAAINAFRQEHGLLPIVVCSRVDDYQLLSERLRLNRAVLLQPLSQQQIDAYLSQGGAQFALLQQELASDPALRELARTPLMLSLMAQAHGERSAEEMPETGTLDERRRQLLATYVNSMFKRRSSQGRYSSEQTVRWLASLARMQDRQNHGIFFIERMQKSSLPTSRQRWWYSLSEGVVLTTVVGVIVGMYYALGATVVGFPVRGRAEGLLETLASAPATVRVFALLASGMALGALAGAFVGLGLGLFLALTDATYPRSRDRLKDWRYKTKLALVVGLASGLVCYGPVDFFFGPRAALVHGTIFGTVLGLGTRFVVRPGAIRVADVFGWSWQRARVGLYVGSAVGFALGLLYATSRPDGPTLGTILLQALLWAVKGVVSGLILGGATYRATESTVAPNQGIRRSSTTALRVTCCVWLAGWLGWAVGLSFLDEFPLVQSAWHFFGVKVHIIDSLVISFAPALLFGLAFGGFTCLQHAILRLVLWRSGAAPLDYPHFLDYCAERVLLHKVGGGFIFIHRLLQDYFASLPEGR